ncbi:MAG: DUF2905 domain-containing protein [Parachlamydiaceae bacterium]|nr:DUF2905 domain-containing protein [Parachlamydiaceae bacterium]
MNLSYWLIFGGIVLVALGVLVWLGLPLGKMPGDIHIKGEKSNVYIPIVTSIIVSIVLTILLNGMFWLFRK